MSQSGINLIIKMNLKNHAEMNINLSKVDNVNFTTLNKFSQDFIFEKRECIYVYYSLIAFFLIFVELSAHSYIEISQFKLCYKLFGS
jgi:hypothetical protein